MVSVVTDAGMKMMDEKLAETWLKPTPQLLSRNWMVFQVPSGTMPSVCHYVVGTLEEGFRCSCLGWQNHRSCYHALAVTKVMQAQADISKQQWAEFNKDRKQLSKDIGRQKMARRIKVEVRKEKGVWVLKAKHFGYTQRKVDKKSAVESARRFCNRKAKLDHKLELFIYKADGAIQDRSTYPAASDPRHRKG